MVQIRKAAEGEECRILTFYNQLIEKMKDAEYPLRWEKGVYPVLADIEAAVKAQTMYLAEEENTIIGAFILNHQQGEGYRMIEWRKTGEDNKIAVLHLLASSPACQGKGLGSQMLKKAIDLSRENQDIAIRLDTLPWNVPGKRLYEKHGFEWRGDVELFYPSTGNIAFSMYEFIL